MSDGFQVIPFGVLPLKAERLEKLLAHMCDKPGWFNHPMTADEIYATSLMTLADATVWKWEIWRGGEFAGMLILDRLSPKVDALFHFTLFPGIPLFGLQKLLADFLGYAFQQFDLQRVSVEVPEHHPKLIRFFRQRLGFKYESELHLEGHSLVELMGGKDARRLNLHMTEPVPWLARLGSRREHAHWDGQQYRDLILLRLLRSEHQERSVISPGAESPNAAREQMESLDVARLETLHTTVRTA